MFQIFKNANYDFMGKRRALVAVSSFLVIASIAVIATKGINRGIEFTGGTELQIKYGTTPDLGAIRSALTDAKLPNHLVTTIGKPEEHEVYIRIGLQEGEQDQGQLTRRVLDAVAPASVRTEEATGKFDLNQIDEATLEARLRTVQGVTQEDAARLARSVLDRRREVAIFRSVGDVASLAGMTPEVRGYLEGRAYVNPFAVRSVSFIGPTIGSELLQKTMWAIVGSLAGMLVYLGVRFQLQWGVAAVIALVHDTIITLGLFCLFGKEMSLPVVAAFLTLVGYSVNDTVVVFDRIRENIGKGASGDFATVINTAINQTLSRTIITSLLTWITVVALFLLGGEALNPFSFVLVIGIVVGTYSSVYIASPYLVLVRAYALHRVRGAKISETGTGTRAAKAGARKVRSSSGKG